MSAPNPHAEAERIVNEAHYLDRLAKYNVPVHLREGLVRYLVHRIPPGHFLRAVLENDLAGAVSRGDEPSLAGLLRLVRFLHNEVTFMAHGSALIVREWLGARERDR
jgi:hypothetical protein